MPKSYTSDAGTVKIPGFYVRTQVQNGSGGVGANGVVVIIGEADTGPDYSQETSLRDNAYGPLQGSAIRAKYKSGPLVDAYRIVASPTNDQNIPGSPSKIIPIKTNPSTKAASTLLNYDASDYGILKDRNYGKPGNNIFYTVTAKAAEVFPTTGSFTFIPPTGTVVYTLRNSGAAGVGGTLTANTTPASLVSTVDALSGIAASGGAARTTAQSSVGTLALAVVSGNAISLTYSGTFTTTPSVGDTLVIPQGSVVHGGSYKNVGAYVITAATSSVIYATKLSDAGFTDARLAYDTQTGNFTVGQVVTGGSSGATGTIVADLDGGSTGTLVLSGVSGTFTAAETITDPITGSAKATAAQVVAVPGTITAPQAVSAQAVSGTVANDVVVYAPVTFSLESADPVPGVGKSLEVNELTGGTDLLSRCCYNLSTTAVTWVSTAASPKLLTSATEYRTKLSAGRQTDNVSEDLICGGEIALKIGYLGTTATLTISDTALTTTIAGGSGGNLDLDLADYPTLSDLATYIDSQTGYSCEIGALSLGQVSPVNLDDGTFNICSTHGGETGRIKIDGYEFYTTVNTESALLTFTVGSGAGLPAPVSTTFLSGGLRGATTDDIVSAAIDALEKLDCNFVVTLFCRDAADDKADALTDSNSDYTIESINAALRTHVLKMNKMKARRNRLGLGAFQGTFSAAKDAARGLATPLCTMSFLDKKVVGSDGTLVQLPPWAESCMIAGGQAAGFYRSMTHKFLNCSGSLSAAGDFDDGDDSQIEDALDAGLLVTKRHPNGGYFLVSDQTTYSRDDNGVYNSLQAMYAMNLIALTSIQRMEDTFVGQSTADVTAQGALTYFEGLMADFRRLKLITPSDDAPAGYKNATVTINGNQMLVEAEVKVSVGIDFGDIRYLVSLPSSSASQ